MTIICNIGKVLGKVLLALFMGIMVMAIFSVFGSHDVIMSKTDETLHFVIPLLIGITMFVMTLIALFQT